MKLAVDSEKLKETAGMMQEEIQKLSLCMDAVCSAVRALDGEWQGQAERAYEQKLLMVRQEYAGLEEALLAFSRILLKAADRYEQLDSDFAAAICAI